MNCSVAHNSEVIRNSDGKNYLQMQIDQRKICQTLIDIYRGSDPAVSSKACFIFTTLLLVTIENNTREDFTRLCSKLYICSQLLRLWYMQGCYQYVYCLWLCGVQIKRANSIPSIVILPRVVIKRNWHFLHVPRFTNLNHRSSNCSSMHAYGSGNS